MYTEQHGALQTDGLPQPHRKSSLSTKISSKKGFTLLELTFVLFIMAVVSGFAVSRYAYHIQRTRLIANTQQITQFFKYTYSSAHSLKTPLQVSFTYNRNDEITQFTLKDVKGITGELQTLELENSIVTANVLADSIIFSPTAPIKILYNEFEIKNTGNITIQISSTKKLRSNLVIFYNSGAVQLVDNVESF